MLTTMAKIDPPTWIDTDRGLADLVATLREEPILAVDTEANSMFAYREEVCLIQISTRQHDYLVDPLADLDLARLAPVFADGFITKLFHDAEFDLLVLRRAFPFEFVGLFDTKVAAASLGLPNIGLAALLDEWLGVQLDKKYQRSDWGKRPLTEGQIHYASLDTHYLIELATMLRERLYELGEPAVLEVAAEMRRLVRESWPEPRAFDPEGFTKLRGADRLATDGRRRLRELFILRDALAQQRDSPPFKIMGNDTLVAIAAAGPKSAGALAKLRGVPKGVSDRYGREILACLEEAADMPPVPAPRYVKAERALSRGGKAIHERLRLWRKDLAIELETDASLLLPKGIMQSVAALDPPPSTTAELRVSGAIEPWRVDYYGKEILRAIHDGEPPAPRKRAVARKKTASSKK